MTSQLLQKLQWFLLVPLLILGLYRVSGAQEACESVAQIISAQGEIRVNRILIDNASASRDQMTICVGDTISAGQLSRAAISIFDTETVIRIDQNTELRLTSPPTKDPSFLRLIKGAINILSPAPQGLVVDASFVNAAVEGTEFHIRVEGDRAVVTVLQGQVEVSNSSGPPVSLTSGQSASAQMGQAPQPDSTIIPKEAIQWALYYPPVIDFQEDSAGLTQSDPHFHTRNAARDLSVGSLDSARESIAEAVQLDGADEEVWALRLIIALTQSRADDIEQLLKDANAREFSSAAALIALSYAQQKQFQLQAALESINQAVETHKQSWLARARRSELSLSVGNIDQALTDAQAANDQVANARSQTVLGFALLAQTKISEAAEAFRQAIALGSEDPLPHLGLGLAKIRSGDLAEGRHDIEIALGIDNQNALVRSYLGKAFYEEKRGPLDEVKFAQAKLQDPNDPTPWFYDAIRKQSINQPIEALEDLRESIVLNDNRAVYRSRLLLDEDLAARSASLGRIYRDVGFEQLGLVEGWKSVNTEPSNYSGHRLLADVYSSLPRHQIARVNELFQSQLLQPSNMTPIQPQLAEANLFLLDSAGPSEIAYNEFNPLFNRNRLGFQASGVVGGNSTLGDDIVFYGVTDRWSYSLGQFHFETDGFRENNDLTQNIWNAFVQYRPTFKTSIQAEFRTTDNEGGDLYLLFDPTNFIPTLRQDEDVDSARLGFRHAFSKRSTLLGSLIYQNAESRADLPPVTSIDVDSDSYQVELQHHYLAEAWTLVSGLSFRENDQNIVSNFIIPVPFPPFQIEETTTEDFTTDLITGYIYANIERRNVTVTLGGSVDGLNGDLVDRNSFNPKLGLFWEPNADTTVRAAIFKSVHGLVFSKTNIQPRLEPTQVAGFNQNFFGMEGEKVWRYGAALDHKFTKSLFAGIEFSRRDREVPSLDISLIPPSVGKVDADEDLVRAYAYWTPNSQLSISAEFQYEKYDNNGVPLGEQFDKLKMYRLPLQVNYFHASGISLSLKGTYIDQKGVFQDVFVPGPFPTFVDGSDDFWVFDASLGYRLPKRYGMIAFKVNNLLDKKFRFQDTDPENPSVFPDRFISLRLTLSF